VPEKDHEKFIHLEKAVLAASYLLAVVVLIEPLEMALDGSQRATLEPCRCQISLLNMEAKSLNHALTLLSQPLQTTFSIFLCIFYPPIFRRFEENRVFQQRRARPGGGAKRKGTCGGSSLEATPYFVNCGRHRSKRSSVPGVTDGEDIRQPCA
jgi:hypothetical protein